MPDAYSYRPLTWLTRLTVVLLSLGAASGAVNALSSVMQLELLDRVDATEEEAEATNARQQLLGSLGVGLYVATAICFGIWIIRANRNVRALGAMALPITPGWAVGYFFIPILNLFRPFQAMRDLLKASRDPAKWRSADGSPLLPLWWALWLVSGIIQQAQHRMALGEEPSQSSMQEAVGMGLTGEILDIALCFVATGLVLTIARAQRASADAGGDPLAWPSDHWQGGGQNAVTAEGKSRADENFALRPQ